MAIAMSVAAVQHQYRIFNTPYVASWCSAGVCCWKGILAREPCLRNAPDLDLLSCGGRDSALGEAAGQALLHRLENASTDTTSSDSTGSGTHYSDEVPCSCLLLGISPRGCPWGSAVFDLQRPGAVLAQCGHKCFHKIGSKHRDPPN